MACDCSTTHWYPLETNFLICKIVKKPRNVSAEHIFTPNSLFKGTDELQSAIKPTAMISFDTSKPSGYESLAGNLEPPIDQFDLEGTLRDKQAAEEDSGIKSKQIGVLWENLTVSGTSVTNSVRTFPGAIVRFFNVFETARNLFGLGNRKKEKEVDILKDFRGLARPGEIVLVLGRPGSGCSTFLRVIANQRSGYTGVDGEVSYGPFDAHSFAKGYRGEAIYCQEDDIHHATLTVGQTLGFALNTKIPGKRPYGISRFVYKDRAVTTLLRMLGIEHTKNTLMGGPFVRGISGGERKRVSIAEALANSAAIYAWDNRLVFGSAFIFHILLHLSFLFAKNSIYLLTNR